MINQLTYSLVMHRGEAWILVVFENNAEWNKRIKAVPGCKWSKTYKGWLIPDTPENRKKCRIDLPADKPKVAPKMSGAITLSANKEDLELFKQRLELKGYSKSTIGTYTKEFQVFLQLLGKTAAKSLTTKRIKDYLQYCHSTLQLSEHTIHSRMNALKFYYEQVLGREKFFWDIPRPKKPFLLPKLLNEDELRKLFNSLENRKHKAMLFTAYSAGLRVSEIVKLKISHVDSGRMQILISRAKGKKDRYVNLSPILLDILREYVKRYKPKPKVYLFESEQTGLAYPTRTVQQIFTNAKNKAGISKDFGLHSLKTSFAPHLLEKGTDIKYIKKFLGHFKFGNKGGIPIRG